jgi:hypothetical protein
MDQTLAKKIALGRQLADRLIQLRQPYFARVRPSATPALPRANSEPTPSSSVFFHAWIWLTAAGSAGAP